MTVHETDAQGRQVSISTEEVEWDEHERAWMLALRYLEDASCRRCGTSLAESTDPMHDPDRPDAHHAYVAEAPVECLSCKVLVRSERRWEKSNPDDAPYLIHSAILVPKKPRRLGRRGQVGKRE